MRGLDRILNDIIVKKSFGCARCIPWVRKVRAVHIIYCWPRALCISFAWYQSIDRLLILIKWIAHTPTLVSYSCQLKCCRRLELMIQLSALYLHFVSWMYANGKDNQILLAICIGNLIAIRGHNWKSLFGVVSQCCLWHFKENINYPEFISMLFLRSRLRRVPCG